MVIKWISKNKAFGHLKDISTDVEKLKRISHPNMIKYYEIYEDKRTIFIVMEFIGTQMTESSSNIVESQESLFDILLELTNENKAFQEYEAAMIMKKLLNTINFCHSNKIMHKDLKPKKILFTEEGEIKLIDFGLSKWKSTGEIYTASGTPYYLAPEVIYGVKTSKSDIWSLGVLLYCLLSGALPFVSDSQESVYDKAKEADVHFDTKCWSSISYEARDLIQKMVDRDYHHRYNAEEWLGHEWFINALSDSTKKKYYTDYKYK